MKIERILRKIGLIIRNGEQLTLASFKKSGIKGKDITRLEYEGLLVKNPDGTYNITSIEPLYAEGKRLMLRKNYENARDYFNSLIYINPNHLGANFELFLLNIVTYNFEDAVKYLDFLYKNCKEEYKIDYNFYWLLLSNVTILPEEYQELVKNLTIDSLRISMENRGGDINPSDIDLENLIRRNVYNRKFYNALNLTNELKNRHKKCTTIDVILKILIKESYKNQDNIIFKEVLYIKNNDYEGLVRFINSLSNKGVRGLREEYLLKLVNVLDEISSVTRLPQTRVVYTNNVFHAIDYENYPLALNLSRINSKTKNGGYENPIELMLIHIVNALNDIKKYGTAYSSKNLEKVLKALNEQDLDNFKIYLKEFLNFIHKNEFEDVILDLLKLDIESNNTSYSHVINLLISLNKSKIQVDNSLFIKEFYNALSNYNFRTAYLYLDILRKLELLGIKSNTTELYEFLKQAEDKYTKEITLSEEKKNRKLIDKINETEEVHETSELDEYIQYSYLKMIEFDKVGTLIRLYPNELSVALNITNNYDGVRVISLDNYLILIREDSYQDDIDYNEIKNNACKAFKNEDYLTCALNLNILLGISSMPNIYMARYFKMLGICYYKTGGQDLALEYLTISNLIYKSLNIDGGLEEYLSDLNEYEEDKPEFIMNLEDFVYDDNNYGIDNLLEISHLICGSGVSTHKACEMFNLDLNKEALINLILARDAYIQGLTSVGDMYLKNAEMIPNKSADVKKLLSDLKANKLFYKGRKKDDYKPLVILPLKEMA